ncbi:MAG: UPF0158 family protein [Deltaproteobacteria bacterium]|nr:UPF0158 family protein [Myxococcales bacterium]MDP3217187.1 UPF0158 family protein [Deltaproteobacteria bacterium]
MTDEETPREKTRLEISWEALEDAFENNAPEVHSYLHRATGEVLRVVDGVADPTMHQRIAIDASYLRVDPVSSREQYRWMERFIATVPDGELRTRLVAAIDGKGAFRRFKDVLLTFPTDRERWFQFRTERLRSCMEAWLDSHDLEAVPRVVWTPPAPEAGAAETPAEDEAVETLRRARMGIEGLRRRLRDAVDGVPSRDLETALAFLEWLRDRGHAAASDAFDPRDLEGE